MYGYEIDKINAYEIFNLQSNFTLSELKHSFKKLAKEVHPDKGGNEELFQLLYIAYKKMLYDLEQRESLKNFKELKSDFTEFEQIQSEKKTKNIHFKEDQKYKESDDSFINKFNTIFTENRLNDNVIDKGYSKYMMSSSKERQDIDIKTDIKKFEIKSFNKRFDNKKDDTINPKRNKQIIRYHEPEPQTSCNDKLHFYELGIDKVTDYTGENKSIKNLNYCDYMVAHNTNKLVDHKKIKIRKSHKNLKDLENDRKHQNFDLTKEEEDFYQKKEKKKEFHEKQRVEYQKNLDNLYTEHFEKINKLFLKK